MPSTCPVPSGLPGNRQCRVVLELQVIGVGASGGLPGRRRRRDESGEKNQFRYLMCAADDLANHAVALAVDVELAVAVHRKTRVGAPLVGDPLA